MTDEQRHAALKLIEEAFSNKVIQEMTADATRTTFAPDLGKFAFENCFSSLWTRPGLDRRARSLLTIGILIALRATEELRTHFVSAVANGCTITELEEVIYHATAYAGFPAAVSARRAAVDGLLTEGLIKEEVVDLQKAKKLIGN